jgi:hypothetical protein
MCLKTFKLTTHLRDTVNFGFWIDIGALAGVTFDRCATGGPSGRRLTAGKPIFGHHNLASMKAEPGPKMPAIENFGTSDPVDVLFLRYTATCSCTRPWIMPGQRPSNKNGLSGKLALTHSQRGKGKPVQGQGLSCPGARTFGPGFFKDFIFSQTIGIY